MANGFGLGAVTPTQRGIARLRPGAAPATASELTARTEVGPIQPPTGALAAAPSRASPDIAQARVGGGQLEPSLFETNPLRAIGLVLSNIAAGFEGRTLPTEEFERQRLEQEKLRQSQVLLGVQALETFAGLAPNLDEEGRKALANQFNQLGLPIDFLEVNLKSTVELSEIVETFSGTAPEFVDLYARIAGGPGALAADNDPIAQMRAANDAKYLDTALRKTSAGIQATLEALTPEQREIAQGQTFDFSFISEKAQELGLKPFEVASLERNQDALIPLFKGVGGQFVTEELQAKISEKRALAAIEPPEAKAVNILLPDGNRATGRELPSGELQIVGAGGALTPAPPGSLVMSLQAAPGELPDEVLRRKAVGVSVTAKNIVALAEKTLEFLRDPSLVLGGAGSTIVFAQGLVAQATQLAQAFSGEHFAGDTGEDLSLAEMLDPGRYSFEGMQAVSAANVRTKANIVAMAYIVARTRDPGGRLSDKDVQFAMETFGLKSNDKDIIAAAIGDRVEEVLENARNFIEEATGERPTFEGLGRPEAGAGAGALPKVMTIEELEERARQGGGP